MDATSRSVVASTTKIPPTPPPPPPDDGKNGLHLGISLGVSCVSMIVVPLITFLLFWVVYRFTQKRKLKREFKQKQRFRRNRLRELKDQERVEQERSQTSLQPSPKVQHDTRIHFGDNVTVNIQVMRCEAEQSASIFDADNLFSKTSNQSKSENNLPCCTAVLSEDLFFSKSKSTNLVFGNDGPFLWDPGLMKAQAVVRNDFELDTNTKLELVPLVKNNWMKLPKLELSSCEQQCRETGENTSHPSSRSPSVARAASPQVRDFDTPGIDERLVQQQQQQQQQHQQQPVLTSTTERKENKLAYTFNDNIYNSSTSRTASGGRPCVLHWLSSVDIPNGNEELVDTQETSSLLRTKVSSEAAQDLATSFPVAQDRRADAHPATVSCLTEKSSRCGGVGSVSAVAQDSLLAPSGASSRLTSSMGTDGSCSLSKLSIGSANSSNPPSVDLRTNPSLAVMDCVNSSIDTNNKTRLNVCQADALQEALRTIKKPNFDPRHSLEVRFVGDEPADLRGSRGNACHAFFRLVLQQMLKLEIFSGSLDKKTIVHNSSALGCDLYKHCGCLIALSIAHGGPSPQFFSHSAYDVIVGGSNTVPDEQTEICWSTFLQGLATLNVLDTIRANVQSMESCFKSPEVPLVANDVEAIFSQIDYSPKGSQNRKKEERAVSYFRNFLVEVEEGLSSISLTTFLLYATSAETIPALGFYPTPSLDFVADSNEVSPSVDRLGLVLTLPTVDDYDVFKRNMESVVEQYIDRRRSTSET